TVETARSGLFALTQRLNPFATQRAGQGQPQRVYEVSGMSAQPFTDTVLGTSKPVIIALTLAVALLLVIACINIGNLMLVRLLGRSREIAVRSALGAKQRQIARLFIAEASLLAIAGGTVGCFAAIVVLRLVHTAAPVQLPRSAALDAVGAPLATRAGRDADRANDRHVDRCGTPRANARATAVDGSRLPAGASLDPRVHVVHGSTGRTHESAADLPNHQGTGHALRGHARGRRGNADRKR